MTARRYVRQGVYGPSLSRLSILYANNARTFHTRQRYLIKNGALLDKLSRTVFLEAALGKQTKIELKFHLLDDVDTIF